MTQWSISIILSIYICEINLIIFLIEIILMVSDIRNKTLEPTSLRFNGIISFEYVKDFEFELFDGTQL